MGEKDNNILSKLEDLDLSFRAWLKKSNNFNEAYINKLYTQILNSEKEPAEKKNLEGSAESIDKNKNTIICEIKFLVYKNFELAIFVCLKFQTNIFFIQALSFFLYLLRCHLEKQLEKIKKDKLEELKNENKKILEFKKFRKTYKICNEAVELLKSELNQKNIATTVIDSQLEYFKKILSKRKTGKEADIDCLLSIDFTKGRKEMLNITKNFLSDNKNSSNQPAKYLNAVNNWYKKVFNYLSRNIDNVRESQSGKFELKEKKEINELSDWMCEIRNDVKIEGLAMLSSHDAGSYSMKPNSDVDVVGKAAQTQKYNFMGQLNSEVRHFDFRMKIVKSIPVFFHGPVTGAPVTEAISHLVKFIESHRQEIIILQVKADKACFDKFYKLPTVKRLENYVYYDFNGKMKCPAQSMSGVTLGDVREAGKNVLILGKGQTISKFNEKERKSHDIALIVQKELCELQNKVDGKFHKIAPIDTAKITDFIKKGQNWIPLSNAEAHSKKIYDKLVMDKDFKRLANIVGIDDVGSDAGIEFAKKIVAINKQVRKLGYE